MDRIETALDHLEDAMSDLRWAKRAPTAEQRAWSVSKANASLMRAQDVMDGLQSEILETTSV
ncbi:hypothetical protein [Lacticaseibacillus paracasei]|uniref:hypothetical protein n=1 Tax=Lacticaseibacillus paracasei TaxID=1597 RepID=UPI0019525925|nr:hypothetical protein [Lacticaseibacillus paracasei]MBM6453144.1 hypothetical protein [Lacticaseibacillus paracasei]